MTIPNGSKGIGYFTLALLGPSAAVTQQMLTSGGNVAYIARRWNGATYIFAVNVNRTSADVRFNGSALAGKSVKVFEEGRTIAADSTGSRTRSRRSRCTCTSWRPQVHRRIAGRAPLRGGAPQISLRAKGAEQRAGGVHDVRAGRLLAGDDGLLRRGDDALRARDPERLRGADRARRLPLLLDHLAREDDVELRRRRHLRSGGGSDREG